MNKYDILAWFFPNKCAICGCYVTANECVCQDCMPEKPIERNFYIINGQNKNFFVCKSLYYYENNFKVCVKRLKFQNKTAYARKFMNLAKVLLDLDELKRYDSICYVPISKSREKARGYNQSKLIAKELGKITGLEVLDILVKIKENKIQHSLKREDRLNNVKGVYSCIKDIKGQNILLVDDIITTGATISQCAKVLYKKGANTVMGICIADRDMEIVRLKES